MRKDFRLLFGVATACAVALLASAATTASANTFFATQTAKACTACHNPGQEQLGPRGLNNYGTAFKSCGYKDCPAPAAAAATTESNDGLAIFSNSCQGGQVRWVGLRPGRNITKRDVVLILDPGQRIKVGVSRGTTWAAQCGRPPSDNDQFHWVRLEQVL